MFVMSDQFHAIYNKLRMRVIHVNDTSDIGLISIQNAWLERSSYKLKLLYHYSDALYTVSRYYYHLYKFSAKVSPPDFLANIRGTYRPHNCY